jgi:hypothetical protein
VRARRHVFGAEAMMLIWWISRHQGGCQVPNEQGEGEKSIRKFE